MKNNLCFFTRGRNPHRAVVLFKYLPVVTAGIMYIHVAVLLTGWNIPIADKFAGMSVVGTLVAYVASHDFGFCRIHKNMLLYTVSVDTCIWIQKYWGFGSLRFELQILFFIIGTAIFVHLIINRSILYRDEGKLI